MAKSKRSSGSEPPEFFADRCLGKSAPAFLIALGWAVHIVADHFPGDGQAVSDPEWIEYGLQRGWSLLTQDERIRTQPAVAAMLREYGGCIHCLDSANLSIHARVARFDKHRRVIYQHVRDGKAGFFIVHEFGPPQKR